MLLTSPEQPVHFGRQREPRGERRPHGPSHYVASGADKRGGPYSGRQPRQGVPTSDTAAAHWTARRTTLAARQRYGRPSDCLGDGGNEHADAERHGGSTRGRGGNGTLRDSEGPLTTSDERVGSPASRTDLPEEDGSTIQPSDSQKGANDSAGDEPEEPVAWHAGRDMDDPDEVAVPGQNGGPSDAMAVSPVKTEECSSAQPEQDRVPDKVTQRASSPASEASETPLPDNLRHGDGGTNNRQSRRTGRPKCTGGRGTVHGGLGGVHGLSGRPEPHQRRGRRRHSRDTTGEPGESRNGRLPATAEADRRGSGVHAEFPLPGTVGDSPTNSSHRPLSSECQGRGSRVEHSRRSRG